MNKHYLSDLDEETTMTEQQRLNSDLEDASNFGRGVMAAVALAFLILVAVWSATVSAQAARTAVIQYQAVSTRTDGTNTTGAVSYEVWQGLKGATKTRIGTITSLQTTIDTGLLGGNEYCWHVVAVEAGNAVKSAPSNEACKAFAQAGPNVVTITVT